MYDFGPWKDTDSTQHHLREIGCEFSWTPRGQPLETDQLRLKIHAPTAGDATFRQDRPVITAVKGSCNCTEKHTELREDGSQRTAAFKLPISHIWNPTSDITIARFYPCTGLPSLPTACPTEKPTCSINGGAQHKATFSLLF